MSISVCEHAFNRAVDATLTQSHAISDQRAGEYEDTWALENQAARFLDMVLREVGSDRSRQAKRLMHVASLCDVKISRTLGPYKSDSVLDLINYLCALHQWMDEYRSTHSETSTQ